MPDFSISQYLYVNKAFLHKLAKEPQIAVQSSGNEAKITLASSEDHTITEQYESYKNLLDKITGVVSNGEV